MNSTTTNPAIRRLIAVSSAALIGLALAGCSATTTPAATTAAPAVSESAVATEAAEQQLSIVDPWVKATENQMTGVFGTVTNETGAGVQIVSATASTGGMVELHETIVQSDGSSMMQEKEGGFVIPAGGTLELKPGDNHIMLMGLTDVIMPGDEVTITLELGDGSTFEFVAVAKEYTGGMETYAPDGSLENNPHGDPTDSEPMHSEGGH